MSAAPTPSAARRRPLAALATPQVSRWLVVLGLALAALALPACQVDVKTLGNNPCNPDPCKLRKGVCGDWQGTCSVDTTGNHAICSGWTWVNKTVKQPKDSKGKLIVKPTSYAVSDTTCDGLDNDCDGRTDDAVDTGKPVCSKSGVCAAGKLSGALCLSGAWQCDFTATPAYEVSETTCDGVDNDCDGTTDEDAVARVGDCKRQGVCAGLTPPVCTLAADALSAAWQCGYADAPDYESVETKCDGKDNDCDGIADSNLDVSGLTCLAKGACATGVVQACMGGAAACDYAKVQAYQPFETACDGIDNDCDGQTDNLGGTNLPLVGTETTGCADKGVCGVFKNAVQKVCKNGIFGCAYSAVPGYEATEASCDSKDNDCDGQIDNGVAPPAKLPCSDKGVCSSIKVGCSDGLFSCDFGSVAKYEAFEQSCDGLDNDCDGQTDESVSTTTSKCNAAGACAYGVLVNCTGGKPVCDYSHVPAFQDVTETSCDGVDNDCDGKTDEPDGLDAAKSGCTSGVCAGKAKASCTAGKWQCDTSEVAAYQKVESTCDGLDNDCNGLTDDSLQDSSAAACPTAGVCQKGVAAGCVGGKWLCNLQAIAGWEPVEQTCDGVDNNCDGSTDPGVCATGATCSSNANCASNHCATLLDGSAKVCVEKSGQCPLLAAGGKVQMVEDAAGQCTSSGSIAMCSKGVWGSSAACPASLVCNAGACVTCVANALGCSASAKTSVVKCAADGKSSVQTSTCATGNHCAGAGVCVGDAVFAVSDTVGAASPQGVALTSGGFALAWLNDTGSTAEVRVRMFSADGKAAGPSAIVPGKKAKPGSRLAIAAVGNGFGLAWVTSGLDQDIAVQLFDATGAVSGEPIIANGGNLDGTQLDPALAASGSGIVVVWSGDNLEGTGDKGIGLQRFDLKGIPIGDMVVANQDDGNAQSTIDGDQVAPLLVAKPTGEYMVMWTHAAYEGFKSRIRGRLFTASDKPAAGVVTVSLPTIASSQPAAALGQGEFLLGWTVESGDGAGTAIATCHTDGSLKTTSAIAVANTITAGDQDSPWLATTPAGLGVLVWRSVGAVSGESSSEIDGRDMASSQGFSSDEAVLTKAAPAGDQDQPRAFVFADGRALYLWRTKAASAPGAVEALFR